jgi:hypothetical protein
MSVPNLFDEGVMNLLHLPVEILEEITSYVDKISPFLGTSKSVRNILQPTGQMERFLELPPEIQNLILELLSYKDLSHILSTSKIVSASLRKDLERKPKLNQYMIVYNLEKEINHLIKESRVIEAIDLYKNFIIDNYELIQSDEEIFEKVKQLSLILIRNTHDRESKEELLPFKYLKHRNPTTFITRIDTPKNLASISQMKFIDDIVSSIFELNLVKETNIKRLKRLLKMFEEKLNLPSSRNNKRFILKILDKYYS